MTWRTRFLGLTFAVLALAAIACGGSATATPVKSSTSNAPTESNASTDPAEERVLKVAMTFLDEAPDPYQAGWLAVPTGLAETLFRLSNNLNPEPWLASGAVQVEPTTWK